LHVLDQIEKPRFTVVDTMDLWINHAKESLLEVIRRVDMLTLNESEARHLSGEHTLLKAARSLLGLGPKYVLIKKGEHGSILFSEANIFLMPAFPLDDVQDPTGAGDTFAGGLMGALAAGGKTAGHLGHGYRGPRRLVPRDDARVTRLLRREVNFATPKRE
jgi:sugar/nucleoside kinase (ribokinase family)